MIEFVERYRPFADFLTKNAFMVVGHDHLGHGDSVASKDDWGYFAENPSDTVIADMHTLRTMVQKENPGVPYFMMGHSMGSYMLRKYLTVYNDDLRGAIIMGTGCVPDNTTKLGINVCKFLAKIFGWHHRSKLVESLSFGGPYKKYDLSGKTLSNSWLTKDEDIVKFYYSEPRCTFKFTLNGYLGLMEAVLYDNQLENVKKVPNKLPIFIVRRRGAEQHGRPQAASNQPGGLLLRARVPPCRNVYGGRCRCAAPSPCLGSFFILRRRRVEQYSRPQAASNQPGNLDESLPARLDEYPQNPYTIRSRRSTK